MPKPEVLHDDGRLVIDLTVPFTTATPVTATEQGGGEHLSKWGLKPGCHPYDVVKAAVAHGWKLEAQTGHDRRVLVFVRAEVA